MSTREPDRTQEGSVAALAKRCRPGLRHGGRITACYSCPSADGPARHAYVKMPPENKTAQTRAATAMEPTIPSHSA